MQKDRKHTETSPSPSPRSHTEDDQSHYVQINATAHDYQLIHQPFTPGADTHKIITNHRFNYLSQTSRHGRLGHSRGWQVGTSWMLVFGVTLLVFLAADGMGAWINHYDDSYDNDGGGVSQNQHEDNVDTVHTNTGMTFGLGWIPLILTAFLIRYLHDEKKYIKGYCEFTRIMGIENSIDQLSQVEQKQLLNKFEAHSLFLLNKRHGNIALAHLLANVHKTGFADSASLSTDSEEKQISAPDGEEEDSEEEDSEDPESKAGSTDKPVKKRLAPEQIQKIGNMHHEYKSRMEHGESVGHTQHTVLLNLRQPDPVLSNLHHPDREKPPVSNFTFIPLWVFSIRKHMSHSGINTSIKNRANFLKTLVNDPFYTTQTEENIHATESMTLALAPILYVFFSYCRADATEHKEKSGHERHKLDTQYKKEKMKDIKTFQALDPDSQRIVTETLNYYGAAGKELATLLFKALPKKSRQSMFSFWTKRGDTDITATIGNDPSLIEPLLKENPETAATHFGSSV